MENFTRLFRSLPGITDSHLDVVAGSFDRRSLKEKDYFCREGEICKQIGYIEKGCLSYFTLTEDGKKSIIHFAFEDWWAGDLGSFLNRTTATTYWQAMEDTDMMVLPRTRFDELCEKVPPFAELYRAKTHKAYLRTMANAARDKIESAEEKYLRLMAEQPQVLQRIPHYDVAAYLGIAPESLSRIRKKISAKK